MQTDRQTDKQTGRHDEANSSFSKFANVPKMEKRVDKATL